MTNLTDADLSRLFTHVVIHKCRNATLLHLDTFWRLRDAGLVAAEYSSDDTDFPNDFCATPKGRAVVEAMLRAGREAIG
jgi:hypothetical protein